MKTAASRLSAASTAGRITPWQVCVVVIASLLSGGAIPSSAQTPPTTSTTLPSPPPTRNVLAHGTDDRLWVAAVVPNADRNAPGERTVIRARGTGDDAKWQSITELPSAVVALGARGSELVALLGNGEWRLIGGAGSDVVIRSGTPLPQAARLLALAGNNENLWGIGFGEAPPRPSTTSATEPAVDAGLLPEATSAPAATRPVPRLRLYRLEAGLWRALGALPDAIKPTALWPLGFAVIGGTPTLAAPAADGSIHGYQWNGAGNWIDRAMPPLKLPVDDLSLLDLRKRLLVWASARSGASMLLFMRDDGEWSKLTPLQPSPTTAPADRVIASAFGQAFLIVLDQSGTLTEQAIDENGTLTAAATEIVTASPGAISRVGQIINLGVMLLLTWVMVVALRRRGRLQRALLRLDQLHLAPLGVRFAAGMIDAIPLLVLPIVGLLRSDATLDRLEDQITDPTFEIWLLVSIAVYLIYTTATELIFARTPGKMLFGLRVADLDGRKPTPQAFLGRNLLRIVDVMLLLPVTMVLFSPLRQRVGDLSAGTIVIRGELVESKPDAAPDEESS